jgi:uncharacterized protein (TIGR02391 family)
MNRPIPKAMLKKMFLKILWEITCLDNRAFPSAGRAVDGILLIALPGYFKLKKPGSHVLFIEYSLLETEVADALEGIDELERDGFIRNDPAQGNPRFKLLTDRGRLQAERALADMMLETVDVSRLLMHPELISAVENEYGSQDFDGAVLKALGQVEAAVRTKAMLPRLSGQELMSAAFNPTTGKLKNPNARTPAEHDALLALFRGACGWFRNPVANKAVLRSEPSAAQILGFADLLLTLLEECVKR